MSLVGWLRRHAALVWLAALALAALGARQIGRLPSGIYPELTFPRVVVVAHAGSLPPELVEAQVTRPLEQALATVPGVRHVAARTIRGAVELSLLLTDAADPLLAQQACQAAVARVELPRGATTVVERVLPTAVPVITYDLAGLPDARRLRELAERQVRPALVRVPGVGGVELTGGRVREVEVLLHPAALAALHLTPAQLAARLEEADRVVAVGRVFEAHQTLPVVIDAGSGELGRLRELPIALGPAGPVPLAAVAEVVEGAEDPEVIVRGAAGEAVAVSVARLPGASTPAVVEGVRRAVDALRASGALPPGVALTPAYDQAELVDEALRAVRDAILLGIALSLGVIALALRDLRAGLVAALPVPLALLATFAVMGWLGLTLNLMSLGGLAVAIGLVVDDAIVVTEGIVRRVEEGLPVPDAVERGTQDMTAAVVGTTLTTVVVFAPLATLGGVTGRFLAALAATLAIAVLLSMALALSLLPLVAGRVLRARRGAAAAERPGPARGDRLGRLVGWLVRRRWVAVALVAALAGGGLVARAHLATGFLPAMDEGAFVVDFFLPAGTSLEETDRAALAIDEVLRTTPAVAAFTRRTGAELGPAAATMQSRGDIMVKLVPRGRRASILDVIDEVRGRLRAEVPQARFEYTQVLQDVLADLAGNPAPLELRVRGDDVRALEVWAAAAGERLAALPGLVDVFDGREGAAPLLRGRVDPVAAARLGASAADVEADLEVGLGGRVVAQLRRPDRAIGVRVRFPDELRFSAEALARAEIAYGPSRLPLGDVVAFDRPVAPVALRRDGLRPAVVLTAATRDGDLGGAEAAALAAVRDLPLPSGAQLEVGGQAASARAARASLWAVVAAAAVLVLLVLLAQLRSLRLALVVLVGAPLATVGALAVLALVGLPLDVSSLTGLVLLVGLVVKNGILLLEEAQRGLAAGAALEAALVAAARRRLRPIAMTTVATLAGLAPLAVGVGAGAELQRPLAVAVIGGLALSTLVSLVVTPGLTALLLRNR